MNENLYPALVDYVFDYCGRFMNDKENKANWHHFAIEKSGNGTKEGFYNHFKETKHISSDPEVLALLENGFNAFKIKVASRIYNEHKEKLDLNLCPKCFKIARAPQAKQCRFCFHDWH
ncbi:MAG TPA: hypothetical protein PLP23_03315 [Panacibacter sp.]|nr:hypothetical protein [Panacibacter sp.]